MPSKNPIVRARGQVGLASRKDLNLPPEALVTARQNLATEKLAAYVARVVAEAPPLRPEQRERIVSLLTADGAA